MLVLWGDKAAIHLLWQVAFLECGGGVGQEVVEGGPAAAVLLPAAAPSRPRLAQRRSSDGVKVLKTLYPTVAAEVNLQGTSAHTLAVQIQDLMAHVFCTCEACQCLRSVWDREIYLFMVLGVVQFLSKKILDVQLHLCVQLLEQLLVVLQVRHTVLALIKVVYKC